MYDAKYDKSSTETVSDAQNNITNNLETVTHTSNTNVEQKLFSCHTIRVLTPQTNRGG